MNTAADPSPTDYAGLTPDTLLDAVEEYGYRSDGRFIALNSYENRVYQVGIEDDVPIIAKFYRPGRWSDEAIAEEHHFAMELAAQEIPVVAPLVIEDTGRSWARSKSVNGSAGLLPAFMQWDPPGLSVIDHNWTSTALVTPRYVFCLNMNLYRHTLKQRIAP